VTTQRERRIRTTEAAEILGVSAFTVGVLTRAGRLPHYRIQGRIYFSPDELVDWIEAQHVPPRRPKESR
jgi:excisionase family DNA binding protein